jgi:hypothetical protein
VTAGACVVAGGKIMRQGTKVFSDGNGSACCCGVSVPGCFECAGCDAEIVVSIAGVIVRATEFLGGCEWSVTRQYDFLLHAVRYEGLSLGSFVESADWCTWIDPGLIGISPQCQEGEAVVKIIDVELVSGPGTCVYSCPVDVEETTFAGMQTTCFNTDPRLFPVKVWWRFFGFCNPDSDCVTRVLPETWLDQLGGVQLVVDPCPSGFVLPAIGAGIELSNGDVVLDLGTWTVL